MQITDTTVALVTGGASGLGGATARRLHADGAQVVIVDLASSPGAALADELGERVAVRADRRARRGPGPGRRRRRAVDRRAADRRQLRGHRHRRAGSSASTGRCRSADFPTYHRHQPGRHLQRAAPRRGGDARERAGRRRPRRHRHDRAASPPTTARSARRRMRRARAASSAHPVARRATWPTSSFAWSPSLRAPSRRRCSPGLPHEATAVLEARMPHPSRLGQPRGVRRLVAPHRRQRHAQRRGHPARRRPADAAALSRIPSCSAASPAGSGWCRRRRGACPRGTA